MSNADLRGKPSSLARVPMAAWPTIVAILAAVAYVGSVSNGFALDDVPLVRDNPAVRTLSGLPHRFVEPYWPNSPQSGLHRPVTIASFALDHAVAGGMRPSAFHAVNVVLHALVTVLVWFLARGIGVHYGTAIVTAGLFAVHPLHTEAVANIAGRAELLAAAGVLAAWLAHRRARREAAGSTSPSHVHWSILAACAWLFAILSKESAILAPLVFAFDDRWHADGNTGSRRFTAARSAPWIGYAVALSIAIGLRATALGGLRGSETAIFLDNPPAFLGTFTRAATAMWVQLRYAGLAAWPVRLSSDYSHAAIEPVSSLGDPRLWITLAVTGFVGALFAVGLRRARPVALAVVIWVAFFLPSSGLVFATGTVMAERLAYLPSFGFCLLAGHLIAGTAAGLETAPRRALVAVTAMLVLAGMARTVVRVPDWRDNTTLALRDVLSQPRSAKLQGGAGIALAARGDAKAAEAAFRRAVEIYPAYAQMHFNLGQLLMQRGARDDAIVHLTRATEIAPDNPRPYPSLAALLEQAGQEEAALVAWAEAARLDRGNFGARFNYGRALIKVGRSDAARESLRDLADDAAGSVPGALALGLIAELDGDATRARRVYESLLTRPDLAPGIRANVRQLLTGLAPPAEQP